jgi:prepilin-type N-terminal cleavage/methylation domain-containing protein
MKLFPENSVCRRGFTFVELMMGLVITTLIMAGIAAIMSSVSDAWELGQITQSTQLQTNLVQQRVQRILSGAKYVVVPSDGTNSANIIFWANDNLIADSTVEAGELGLIEWDTSTNSLNLWEAMPSIPAPDLSAAQTQLNWTALQTVTASSLKTWPYMQCTTLGGPGSSGNANALQVTSASFYAMNLGSATQLPVIEFSLGFTKNGQTVNLYGTTTLRAPTTQPE